MNGNGTLPTWVTITVLLTVTGLLVYSVVAFGPKGYPLSVMLGGLIGAYGGLNELLRRRAERNGKSDG